VLPGGPLYGGSVVAIAGEGHQHVGAPGGQAPGGMEQRGKCVGPPERSGVENEEPTVQAEAILKFGAPFAVGAVSIVVTEAPGARTRTCCSMSGESVTTRVALRYSAASPHRRRRCSPELGTAPI
jgi:hypothetical protein